MKQFFLLAGLVVTWRYLLIKVGELAQNFFSFSPSYPYAEALLNYGLPSQLTYWAGFDGVYYLGIADNGYVGTGLVQAFFPTLPMLISLGSVFFLNYLTSALLVTNLALFLMIIVFFRWMQRVFSIRTACFSLIAMLLFPTAFYFGAVYNEGLFLLLVFLSFWAAEQKKWLWAGLLAGVASATRLVGIFIFPALLFEFFVSEHSQVAKIWVKSVATRKTSMILNKTQLVIITMLRSWRKWSPLLLSVTGLAAYMIYLQLYFGNPFYFSTVQADFGTGRQSELISLPQVYWRYIKILTTVSIDWKWFTYLQDIFLTTLTLVALTYAWFRSQYIKKSWIIFSLFAVVLPTMTGTLSSMPRYVLVAFPIFILWAELLQKSKLWYGWLVVSGILLCINTMLFIQGWWVA